MNCTICDKPLEHTPQLGAWTAHPFCEAAVTVRVREAADRATRVERLRIHNAIEVDRKADSAYDHLLQRQKVLAIVREEAP